MFRIGEIVRSGNSSARVKNIIGQMIVLYDINGAIEAGTTITGDDSGEILTLTHFTISEEFDDNYEYLGWEEISSTMVTQDNGAVVVLDSYFTGLPSQDYETTNVVTL